MATLGQIDEPDQGSPDAPNRARRRHPDQAGLAAGAGNLTRLAYSPAEAGKVLGISRGLVYQLIAAGDLVARKLGARTLITREEIDRYVDSLPVKEPAL